MGYGSPKVNLLEKNINLAKYPESFINDENVNQDFILQSGVHISGLEGGSGLPGQAFLDYFVPTNKQVDYWCNTIGVKYIRIGFRLERLFHTKNSSVDGTYLSYLKNVVDRVLLNGSIPIIDAHNFSSYFSDRIASENYTASDFANMWGNIADIFKYNKNIEFDIMNEPSSFIIPPKNLKNEIIINENNNTYQIMVYQLDNITVMGITNELPFDATNNDIIVELESFPEIGEGNVVAFGTYDDYFIIQNYNVVPTPTPISAEEWFDVCNLVIQSIRQTGATNLIHIPTQASSGVPYIFNLKRPLYLKNIIDPLDNWILHLHLYLDINFSGSGENFTPSDIHALRYLPRVTSLIRDLQKDLPFLKIHLGEFGASEANEALLGYYNVMEYMYENRDVWRSFTAWGAGQGWPNTYPLKIEPLTNNLGTTKKHDILNNMKFDLKKYPKTTIVYSDYASDKYYNSISKEILLCKRNSDIAFSKKNNGEFISFPKDTLRLTDKGILIEDKYINIISQSFFNIGTTYEIFLETDKIDFLGNDTGIQLTESPTLISRKYISFNLDNILLPNKTYSFQYLYDFEDDFYIWTGLNEPYVFSIDGYYFPNFIREEGVWKTKFLTIDRNSYNIAIRCRIGFNDKDTTQISYLPNSYQIDDINNPKRMRLCCPMLGETKRLQSPVISLTKNAVREADDIEIDVFKINRSKNITFILEVQGLSPIEEISEFLFINNICVLRKNIDFSIGGEFSPINKTEPSYNTTRYFIVPRKLIVSIDMINKKISIGAEGIGQFITDFSISFLQSVKIGKFGGYLRKFIILDDYYEDLTDLLK